MTRIPTIFSAGLAAAAGGADGAGGAGADRTAGGGVGAGAGGFCARAAGTAIQSMPAKAPTSPIRFFEVPRRRSASRPHGAAARFIALRCPTLAELNLFPLLPKQKECLARRLR